MDQKLQELIIDLAKSSLPELHKALKAIVVGKSFAEDPSDELKTALEHLLPQLANLTTWAAPELAANFSRGENQAVETEDLDDAAMLAEMESADDAAVEDDDDAAAMMAQMEAVDDEEAEVSDEDEAAAMLAAMEGGDEASAELSDELSDEDEAARMLAEMEGESDSGAAEDMDDDEAARMLAEMEGGADDEAMGDDEAARMLAEMEGGGDSMEDDDAARLLAEMDGSSDSAEAAEESGVSVAASADDVGEINEWEKNEFQSDPDMLQDFQTNTGEIMELLDEQILNLEQSPDDKEVIEEIFRGAHTLKGAAGMFGFKGLERVMHRTENLFDLIRKGKLHASSDVIDVVLEACDIMKSLLGAVNEGQPCGIKTAPIVFALELVANGKSAPKPQAVANEVEGASAGDGAGDSPKAKKKSKDVSTIRVDLTRLDALVNLVGELVIDRTRFVHVEEQLRTAYPQLGITGNMTETLQLFGRHMNEVQDIIMKVRMVPIGNAFNKFPRLVRDLAKSLGKKIDIFVSGETAELDKTLVEQIGDPLIHLIRNSCDHGVETPDVRVKNGKSENGSIFLSAQQEGNHIVITIQDDGKGMPVDILRKKGIEKGMIGEDDNLTDKDIFNLIFEPGFSTAEKVTEVSGRGVGMDVVKKQIQKLKGMVEIDSEWGQGTTIKIRLPLTLAIVQSLLVEAESEMFAIPLSSVVESLRIHPSEIQRVGDTEVVKIRDQVLPLVHLSGVMKLGEKEAFTPYLLKQQKLAAESLQMAETERKAKRTKERLYVVVVGTADKRYGVVVDQLLNQQEMVIKSMGPFMRDIPCVAGGAVLGHGEVVLVLDVAELIDAGRAKARQIVAAA